MSYTIVQSVYATINGVPLSTPAWECRDVMELRQPAAKRGQNRIIPGAAGVRTKPRRNTETTRQLTLVVNGGTKWDGNGWPTRSIGLDENLDHLNVNLQDPDGDPVPCVLHLPDGTTVSGDVQIEQIGWEYHDHDAVMVIDITIPLGELS